MVFDVEQSDTDIKQSHNSQFVVLDIGPNKFSSYRARFNILILTDIDGSITLRDLQSGNVVAYSPQNVAAIVIGDGGQICNSKKLNEWIAYSGFENVLVLEHVTGLAEVLNTTCVRIQQAAMMNTQLMSRLGELRAIHEELQNSYDSLRTYVAEQSLMPPRHGFINLPDGEGSALPPGVVEVTQPIPLELRSLCGISLHLGIEIPRFAEGKLIVELRASDDEAVFFSWHAPYEDFKLGWTTFAFEQSGNFLRKNPVLHLRYDTVIGHGPLFSLGYTQLRRDKVAIVDGVPSSVSLAFKAWMSVPGAPLTISNVMWPAIRSDEQRVTQLVLSIDDTLHTTDVRHLGDAADHPLIAVHADRKRILVHPFENLPTIARLFDVCPSGTDNVVIEVETDSADAGPIEYAVAILPVGSLGEDGFLPPTIHMSDWLNLPPKTDGTLFLRLDVPLQQSADLYLMTRVPVGGTADNGWAHFKRIVFRGMFG